MFRAEKMTVCRALAPVQIFLTLGCLLELAVVVTTFPHHHSGGGVDDETKRPCFGENCPEDGCFLSVKLDNGAGCPSPVVDLAASENASLDQLKSVVCRRPQKLAETLEKDFEDATTKLGAALDKNELYEASLARLLAKEDTYCLQIKELEDRVQRLMSENVEHQKKAKELLEQRSMAMGLNSRLRSEDGRLREKLANYEKNCSGPAKNNGSLLADSSGKIDLDRPQSTAAEEPEVYIGGYDLSALSSSEKSSDESSPGASSSKEQNSEVEGKQKEIEDLKKDLNSILYAKFQQEKTIASLRAMLRQRASFLRCPEAAS